MDNTWVKAETFYENAHQGNNAFQHFVSCFVEMQDRTHPSKEIEIPFPEHAYDLFGISEADYDYYDVVEKATSLGWAWEETFKLELLTGKILSKGVFPVTLFSWEWAEHPLGARVSFGHLPREGESKASLLGRILDTAERAKKDFPNSIPRQTIRGVVEEDKFATTVVFGNQ